MEIPSLIARVLADLVIARNLSGVKGFDRLYHSWSVQRSLLPIDGSLVSCTLSVLECHPFLEVRSGSVLIGHLQMSSFGREFLRDSDIQVSCTATLTSVIIAVSSLISSEPVNISTSVYTYTVWIGNY